MATAGTPRVLLDVYNEQDKMICLLNAGPLSPYLVNWNARPFLYQLGTIKLVLRGAFDGTRQEAYGRADCEPTPAG